VLTLETLADRGQPSAEHVERAPPISDRKRGVTLIFYEMGEPSLSKFFAHSETCETFVIKEKE
jgi:hypothetical protein